MSIFSYVLFYGVMFILSIWSLKTDEKKRNWIFMAICISFFVFYGFRDVMIGYDTKTYTRYYNSKSADCYVMLEKLFYYFAYLCWSIHIPTKLYIALLTLFVIIINSSAYYLAFKFDNRYLCFAYVGMLCLPYAIMMNINVVRQGIAISALLLSAVLLDRKYKRTGIIVAFIGCLTHYMGFLILAAYIVLYFIKKKKNIYAISMAGCTLGIVAGVGGIGKKILELIPNNQMTRRVLGYLNKPVTMSTVIKLAVYFLIATIIIGIMIRYKVEIGNLEKLFLAIYMMAGAGVSCITVANRLLISIDLLIPILLLRPSMTQRVETCGGISEKKLYVKGIMLFCIAMYLYGIFFDPVKANLGF